MAKYMLFRLTIVGIFILCIGCSKDEEPEIEIEPQDAFYTNVLESAKAENLYKTWSIFSASLDGKSFILPENNAACGRDFFIYDQKNNFTEFLIVDNYECAPEINNLRWMLNKGIITVSDAFGNSDEFVIIELTDQKFVFKAKYDYDENGTEDIFTFIAKPYQPPNDVDYYSTTFNRESIIPHYDKIRLSWRAYLGFNTFDRYEIYRSNNTCNKSNAELIAVIKEQGKDFYVDENPSAASEYCYFFKLYTNKGLLAESDMVTVNSSDIEVATITMSSPLVVSDNIELTWAKFDGYYFSHYEIVVSNYSNGSYGDQEEIIATIDDINTLHYLHTDPPYIINPVYTIRAVNIFGNKNSVTILGKNSWEVIYKRPEILPMDFIKQVVVDTEETSIYLYGRSNENPNENFQKFNYKTNTVVAISNMPPNTSSEGSMKVIKSSFGKELILPVGNEMRVYNSDNLSFKYSINIENISMISDFEYLGDNIWVFTDGDNVITFNRENNKMTEISRQAHFSEHQAYSAYYIVPIASNDIIVGHYNETSNLKFTISVTGQLTNKTTINSIIKSEKENQTIYNKFTNKIYDLESHKIYDATNFSIQKNYNEPFTTTGISTNGSFLFGSNNDVNWNIDAFSNHKKEAVLYNTSTEAVNVIATKGYAHLIFENYLGEIISISSGFKRQKLDDYTSISDVFIEKIKS